MEKVKALEDLGLSEKEAKVYLALLELGQASAYRVAQKSGVKKPTTYVLLDELRKKELVIKMPGDATQMFIAKSPEEFFASARYRVNNAIESLPEILSVMKKQNKVRTMYFEGINGLKQALWHEMKSNAGGELIGFYAKAENMSKELYDLTWKWAEDTKKYDISLRGFVPTHDTVTDYRKADKKYNREMRPLPYEDYSSETSLDVMNDFVRIIDLTADNPQAIIIENERMAKMVRQIFEMMWKLTTPS
ncbi:MAG: TrmB family transcriptional regulator [Candidatus Moraniibacteriota bacterium]|jgi:HTH-type transcriptional regulator, sugar sensing transcriptional regulator